MQIGRRVVVPLHALDVVYSYSLKYISDAFMRLSACGLQAWLQQRDTCEHNLQWLLAENRGNQHLVGLSPFHDTMGLHN